MLETGLEAELDRLSRDEYCGSIGEIVTATRSMILPPERVSTTECVVRHRYLRNPEGTGKRLWSLARTPYMAGPQDALDDPRYRMVIVVGPERSGKALDCETPIATPSGWATMGSLSVGDHVFDADGNPTRVTATSDVQFGRKCLAIGFSDGSEIVCDEEHLWEVYHSPWGGYEQQTVKVLEARELAGIAFRQTPKGTVNRLAVDVAKPLCLPDCELPIPAYTFGAWIGDGTALAGDAANIDLCARGHDLRILGRYKDELARDGRNAHKGRCVACARMDSRHYQFGSDRLPPVRRDTLRSRLESLGVLGNKHVPQQYLRASAAQRLALLQGWMDTDGHISPLNASCELVTVEPSLASAAMELIRSLGLKPTISVKEAYAVMGGERRRGRDAYRIRFMAYADIPVFRLERNLAIQKPRPVRNRHTARRRIVSIKPVESRPVRCIAVANDRKLFLAGREMIPTHNSVSGENHLFKRLRNGPLTDTIIYLQAKSDVDSYADKEFRDLISLHPEIENRLGKTATDRKRELKRIAGKVIQLLPANDGNLRQKEAPYIIATEIDGYRRSVSRKVVQEIRGRQKSFGNQAKAYLESHPDLGWSGGIAAAWKESTRGVFYWPCIECGDWSSPHFLAAKGMRMVLHYDRDDSLDDQDRIDRVADSARLLCPHCGSLIDDAGRDAMVDAGIWVFEGQTIAVDGSLSGDPIAHDTAGFWIHGTMSKVVSLAALAREYVSALVVFERSRDPQRLKRATVKSLGEVYEGAGASNRVIDPEKLRERQRETAVNMGFERGTVPDGFLFVTGAVDVGGSKFDLGFWAWDLEGRSALIDRVTLHDRMDPRGNRINLRPPDRIADWMILLDEALLRTFPLASDPTMALPLAALAIDTGGGAGANDTDEPKGVTWMAREFARRMHRAGQHWGKAVRWQKVNLIKGGGSPRAPEVSRGREINVDDQGGAVAPVVLEYNLNVDKLKTLAVERMAIDDGGPGYCLFANDLPRSVFDELAGEVLIDGKWERRGANETLDLFGYAEAMRIRLDPNRADIKWDQVRPIWARPVANEAVASPDAAPVAAPIARPAAKKTIFERFDALNSETEN